MRLFLCALNFLAFLSTVNAAFPPKIYGVNIGSWLLIEPWMLPAEWISMGGESCDDCSNCIGSEFALVQALGQEVADQQFNVHWTSWFNQRDVNHLKRLGINTVRIPLGYWIVEDLVNRTTEYYPKGGLSQLRRGLQQLQNAGIVALLDHHAPPGGQVPNQSFTGRCTPDVEFYTPENYHRALIWTAVMATLSQVDPAFSNVVSIEAVNEEAMNATTTPGYGEFSTNFVLVVRAVEYFLGIPVTGLNIYPGSLNPNVTVNLGQVVCYPDVFPGEVASAVLDAIPILLKIGAELPLPELFNYVPTGQKPLTTTFMDIIWQHPDPSRSNPFDAALGPQLYDDHLYYSFGGVADPNEDAYMIHICNLNRIQVDASFQNTPVVFGEWALPTQFQASDDFLYMFADAQKLAYNQSAGWMFSNFKIEESDLAGDLGRQWSYFEGVERGYLTRDPSQVNDFSVCEPYIQLQ